jgi:hypothetical protein
MSSVTASAPKIGGVTNGGSQSPKIVLPIPLKVLKDIFHQKTIRKDKGLINSGYSLYPDPETKSYVLPVEAVSYPKVAVNKLDRKLVTSFTFNDEENNPLNIIFTFPNSGKLYDSHPIITFQFHEPQTGDYKEINVETKLSFFTRRRRLTKKQALKLFISSLGEVALIPFLDFFVNNKEEKPYNKNAMIKRAMERLLGKNPLPYDEGRKVFILQ